MSRLEPLSEEPVIDDGGKRNGLKKIGRQSWKHWFRAQFSALYGRRSENDLKILLSVLGCPLSPVAVCPKLPVNQVSYAQYILQHFTAATGCRKLEGTMRNFFATGRVTMAIVDESSGSTGSPVNGASGIVQKGCFVMWQMTPNKWSIELVLGGHKVVAGSDGTVAWRHTPWLGIHAAKGGVRPLRRALQGLDPMKISAIFSLAEYMGESCILGTDCFVLKLAADQSDLADRGDSAAEVIKHVISGHFSQKSGLLVYLEDTFLTRIQSPGAYPAYWETTMATTIEDYRAVEGGVLIAHGGHSSVIITTFGDNFKCGVSVTRMTETWRIDDVAFNVEGLSLDCFIPPQEVQGDCL